ncbi:uncharacterized protein B0T15DRAFT_527172, partial [Chaetomium strumarium]
GARTKVRCYGVCGKPGHNARTCQEVAEASDSAVSDVIVVGLESGSFACLGHSLIIYVII